MTVDQIKQELVSLPADQQDHLLAYLVELHYRRDPLRPSELAKQIDDRDPAHWVDLDELRERWKD
jgi:hypothetical protein